MNNNKNIGPLGELLDAFAYAQITEHLENLVTDLHGRADADVMEQIALLLGKLRMQQLAAFAELDAATEAEYQAYVERTLTRADRYWHTTQMIQIDDQDRGDNNLEVE